MDNLVFTSKGTSDKRVQSDKLPYSTLLFFACASDTGYMAVMLRVSTALKGGGCE